MDVTDKPTLPDRLIIAYLTALPLLWASGRVLQLSVLMICSAALFAVHAPRAWGFAWPWCLVGACVASAPVLYPLALGQGRRHLHVLTIER